jgi:hypothetical protein
MTSRNNITIHSSCMTTVKMCDSYGQLLTRQLSQLAAIAPFFYQQLWKRHRLSHRQLQGVSKSGKIARGRADQELGPGIGDARTGVREGKEALSQIGIGRSLKITSLMAWLLMMKDIRSRNSDSPSIRLRTPHCDKTIFFLLSLPAVIVWMKQLAVSLRRTNDSTTSIPSDISARTTRARATPSPTALNISLFPPSRSTLAERWNSNSGLPLSFWPSMPPPAVADLHGLLVRCVALLTASAADRCAEVVLIYISPLLMPARF